MTGVFHARRSYHGRRYSQKPSQNDVGQRTATLPAPLSDHCKMHHCSPHPQPAGRDSTTCQCPREAPRTPGAAPILAGQVPTNTTAIVCLSHLPPTTAATTTRVLAGYQHHAPAPKEPPTASPTLNLFRPPAVCFA